MMHVSLYLPQTTVWILWVCAWTRALRSEFCPRSVGTEEVAPMLLAGTLLPRPRETLDSDTAAKTHTHTHTQWCERVDRGESVVSVVCFLFPPAVLMPLGSSVPESAGWPEPDLVGLSRKGKR